MRGRGDGMGVGGEMALAIGRRTTPAAAISGAPTLLLIGGLLLLIGP